MEYIASINAFLVEESDIKNGVLFINDLTSPRSDPRFIATDKVIEKCKKVVFGDEVLYVPTEAFKLWKIKEVEFGKNIRQIGDQAFFGCDLKKVDTASVLQIGQRAFSENEELEEVFIGEKLKKMKYGAFSNNPALKKVVISPKNTSLTEIPDYCFYHDRNLEAIENLHDVNWDMATFSGCKKLKLTLPQQTIVKNAKAATVNNETYFPFEPGAELTILVDDYNQELRNIVQKLKEKEIIVGAIPNSKKAEKQLFGNGLTPEENALKNARKRLANLNNKAASVEKQIFDLTIKVANLPESETAPVELGKTKIML